MVTSRGSGSLIPTFFILCLLIGQFDCVRVDENPRTNSLNRRQSNQYQQSNRTDLILSDVNEVNFVLLISDQNELPVFYEIIKPTIELAIKEASRKYAHLRFNLVSVHDSNKCEDNVLGALAAEKYYTSKVNVFIGPICTIALDPVARMASYWNVPVFTAGGISVEFSNKRTFNTLTRMSFSLGKICRY